MQNVRFGGSVRGKLTPEQVCQIPKLIEEETISAIARRFGVTPAAIRNVIVEERWRRYSDEPPGKRVRCLGCGALLLDDTKPCLACSLLRTGNKLGSTTLVTLQG